MDFSLANCNPANNPKIEALAASLDLHHPTALMYPRFINGAIVEPDVLREAAGKEICAACPIKDACLEHALNTAEAFGTWGGLNARERRSFLRRRDY